MIKRETTSETGEPEEQEVLAGFMGRPVFRVEDTDGQPLEDEKLELPPLPLMERAREWGLSVRARAGELPLSWLLLSGEERDRSCLKGRGRLLS